MKKLKIGDLEKIRDRVKSTSALRKDEARVRVTVHMGTCGIAAGAREILSTFIGEIEKKGLKDVLVTTSGCAGLCSREPLATVEIADSPPVKYVDLTPEKVVKILNEHIINDKIVDKFALAIGSERMH
jgi:NADP-reducing hydrogenase subunit HndB